MARSAIALSNYNILYQSMRSTVTTRGVSFNIKTFHDGSAVINLTVTAMNASVTLSVIVSAKYENDKVIGYRVSNEDETIEVIRVEEATNFVRKLIQQTRIILNKI